MNDTISPALLEVKGLKVHFPLRRKNFWEPQKTVKAVDTVSFQMNRGQTFSVIGESGSGKSTTALALMHLVNITEGSILLNGTTIDSDNAARMKHYRSKIQMIFQDPYSSLNPRMRAGDIVREPMNLMNKWTVTERKDRTDYLFDRIGLKKEQQDLFPHQFSGGQRQRIGIARALANNPEIIVCDEPVSALDVAIQAQILNLLIKFQEELGLTYLFISHDAGIVQHMSDVVAVMYLGEIVEQAGRNELFKNPRHPYTKALFSAVPSAKYSELKTERIKLTGDPQSPIDLPNFCRFASRCPFATDHCREVHPELKTIASDHAVACHLAEH